MMNENGGWTKSPNIIDDALASMGIAELKCTRVLVRETYGWHRPKVRITYDQLKRVTGIKSKTTIAAGLKAVEARGFFRRTGALRSEWEVVEQTTSHAAANGAVAESNGRAHRSQFEPGSSDFEPNDSKIEPNAGQNSSNFEPYGSNFEPNGSNIDPYGPAEGSNIGPKGRSNGPNSEPNERPNGPKNEPFLLYKERTPSGKERERERKDPHPRSTDPPTGQFDFKGNQRRERTGRQDPPTSGRPPPHHGIPPPRSPDQEQLAAHPATAVWLEAGMKWPGWQRLKLIVRRLAPEPQEDALAKARDLWLMAGHRESNIGGILDWYDSVCRDSSWTPYGKMQGHGRHTDDMSPSMRRLFKMREDRLNGVVPESTRWFNDILLDPTGAGS